VTSFAVLAFSFSFSLTKITLLQPVQDTLLIYLQIFTGVTLTFDLETLIGECDLDILKVCLHSLPKLEFLTYAFNSLNPNSTDTETDRQTESTERLTRPHLCVVIKASLPLFTVYVRITEVR